MIRAPECVISFGRLAVPRGGRALVLGHVAACLVLILASCVYDLDVPLQNDRPEFLRTAAVTDTVFYPDSSVCTLLVRDLNDERLSVLCMSPLSVDSSTPCCGDTLAWPGVFTCLDKGYDEKRLELTVPGVILGQWRGCALVRDARESVDTLDIVVAKMLRESFDAFPPKPEWWDLYSPDDTGRIDRVLESFGDKKLVFQFLPGGADTALGAATGLHSNFRVAGDFWVSVNFRLRDDMVDGFEVGFFVSTSSDTGKYAGRTFGTYLEAGNGWVNVKCRSTNLQIALAEVNFYAGRLTLSRVDSTVSFGCTSSDPKIPPVELPRLTFPSGDSVFVHLRMRVMDQRKMRHCEWNDFLVEEGRLAFEK